MNVYSLRDKAGGARRLAEAMGVHHSTVQDWLRNGRMPGGRAIQAGRVFGLGLSEVETLSTKPKRELTT